DPYNENGQFGDLTWWQVDENPDDGNDDTQVALEANTEYLLVADSWLHVLTDGSRQLNAAAYDLWIRKNE
ncbi:MAG TPA: hypothetical protein VJ932_04460, partial [Alkalispirochaeta sp.]|nr:hypothetical protein [Alkalispirochaeta sp.]